MEDKYQTLDLRFFIIFSSNLFWIFSCFLAFKSDLGSFFLAVAIIENFYELKMDQRLLPISGIWYGINVAKRVTDPNKTNRKKLEYKLYRKLIGTLVGAS